MTSIYKIKNMPFTNLGETWIATLYRDGDGFYLASIKRSGKESEDIKFMKKGGK